jgi:ABC-type sugar transport system ATPase subunit
MEPPPVPDLLEIRNVSKSFSGVEVLHGVDFDLTPGTVHALVGENGAGKSTLIKILSGVHRRDGGTICIDGQPVEAISPRTAHKLGIVTIYQERNLIPQLSVGENLLLGDAPEGALGLVKWNPLFDRAQQILDNLNLCLDARERVADLGPAEQQAVEIAKALYKKARIVVMDEPTASLSGAEIDNLFRLICQLRQERVSVIYISHRLDEIFEIADEVTVLRDGWKVLHSPISDITKEQLVRAMVGEEITMTRIASSPGTDVLLEADGISRGKVFRDVSLTLRRGTIVALAGMLGSGRTHVLRSLAGIEPITAGRILYKGEEIQGNGLAGFIERGICFMPSERDQSGLILSMSVAGNTTIANLDGVTRGPFMRLAEERAVAENYVQALDIQAKSVLQEVQYLSGGNRQKVMLSKWLYRGLDVFLLDEPTQGVDVGAREEIHQIMTRLLDEGKAILMVTSDLDELMNMSHFIAVMNQGRIVATLDAKVTTREEVLSYAIGNASPDLVSA